METTKEILVREYGVLMDMPALAKVLGRSIEGLRLTMRGNSDLAKKLQAARRKIGRRIHFRTVDVAILIDGEDSETNA